MALFDTIAVVKFKHWLLEHVHVHWPDRVSHIGDDAALDVILNAAIARARSFGIVRSASLARYVNLVMLLGSGFPEDVRISRAGVILRLPNRDEEDKLDAIMALLGANGLDEAALDWGWP